MWSVNITIYIFANKSLTTDAHVRVRRRVVQIPVRKPRIRPVVPVATQEGKRTHHIPYKSFWGSYPPNPLKRFFKKPTTDAHGRERRRDAQIPGRKPRTRPVDPVATQEGNTYIRILVIIISVIC